MSFLTILIYLVLSLTVGPLLISLSLGLIDPESFFIYLGSKA